MVIYAISSYKAIYKDEATRSYESSKTMSKKKILCCMLLVIVGVFFRRQCEANEITEIFFDEGGITATDIAHKAGYPAESYEVVTQDGYILRVDRITGSKKSPPSDNKTPVLLVHGILDASPTWVVAGPERALGTYYQINHSFFLFSHLKVVEYALDKGKLV
ncbi:unnamed protein product, partial [Heterotrigona itama]